jgi:hypothetical protein
LRTGRTLPLVGTVHFLRFVHGVGVGGYAKNRFFQIDLALLRPVAVKQSCYRHDYSHCAFQIPAPIVIRPG